MDPLTVAVLSALAAYVSSTTEHLLDAVGQTALTQTKEMLSRLKKKWSGDEAATRDLGLFESDPGLYTPALAERLDRQFADDSELRAEFQKLIHEIDPSINILQRIAEARGVVGVEAGSLRRGRISVRQDIRRAHDVVGVKIDDLG